MSLQEKEIVEIAEILTNQEKIEELLTENCNDDCDCDQCPVKKECEKYNKYSQYIKLEKNENKTTKEDVLKELKALIGTEFDENEVICAFGDFEENGESQVLVEDTSETCGNSLGYDYSAYINTANAAEFIFWVNCDNVIEDVDILTR